MDFIISPYDSVGSLKFGMPRLEVEQALGHVDRVMDTPDEIFELYNFSLDLIAQVDKKEDQLIEVGFGSRSKNVSFEGVLFFESAAQDVVRRLCKLDRNAFIGHGALVFLNLGLSLSGFVEDDDGTKAITVFARGVWDDIIPSMKPYSC